MACKLIKREWITFDEKVQEKLKELKSERCSQVVIDGSSPRSTHSFTSVLFSISRKKIFLESLWRRNIYVRKLNVENSDVAGEREMWVNLFWLLLSQLHRGNELSGSSGKSDKFRETPHLGEKAFPFPSSRTTIYLTESSPRFGSSEKHFLIDEERWKSWQDVSKSFHGTRLQPFSRNYWCRPFIATSECT